MVQRLVLRERMDDGRGDHDDLARHHRLFSCRHLETWTWVWWTCGRQERRERLVKLATLLLKWWLPDVSKWDPHDCIHFYDNSEFIFISFHTLATAHFLACGDIIFYISTLITLVQDNDKLYHLFNFPDLLNVLPPFIAFGTLDFAKEIS